jgi:hypothetical protein
MNAVPADVEPEPSGIERARRVLDDLIRERQTLRAGQTSEALLEANRLAIIYWQQHLARALIRSRGA